MFRRILPSLVVLTFVVSTANAGVIVGASDSPTISAGSMVADLGNQDDGPVVPVLEKNLNAQMQSIEYERAASAPPAIVVEPQNFVFYDVIQGRQVLFNSNQPLAPDLDGLLKPPQGTHSNV